MKNKRGHIGPNYGAATVFETGGDLIATSMAAPAPAFEPSPRSNGFR